IPGLPGRHRIERPGGARETRGTPAGARPARRDDARNGRLGSQPHDQEPPDPLRDPGRHADRSRRVRGQAGGAPGRRRRLHRQADPPRRTGPEGEAEPGGREARRVRIVVWAQDETLRRAIDDFAAEHDAEVIDATGQTAKKLLDELRTAPNLLVIESGAIPIAELRAEASASGTALVVACHDTPQCEAAALANADEWILLPVQPDELRIRLRTAQDRAEGVTTRRRAEETVQLLRYEELLYD